MSRRIACQAFGLLGLLTAAILSGCQNGFVGNITLSLSGIATPGVENVVLAIKGVELGGDGGPLDLPFGTEELVDIDGNRTVLLDGTSVPVSGYQWVRIDIDPANSYVIASNGDRFALDVASQYQSTADFVIGEGLTTSLLVDVDLRVALSSQTKDGVTVYTLKQNSRLVNQDEIGNIFGTVPATDSIGNLPVSDPNCGLEAYIYAGTGVTPEGFFVTVKGGTTPYSSSPLVLHVKQNIYVFNAALLPPGDYTVALTCAAADVPGAKSMVFTPTQDATVTVGHITDVVF